MTRLFAGAAGCVLLALLAILPARAQETPEALAQQAGQALAAGRTVEALDLAERFSQAVWETAPLAFRRAVLVDAEPTAYGQYAVRASNVYGVDEEIRIYAEPVAFGSRQEGGVWQTDMVADVRVATPEGRIIVAHKAFSEFRIASATRTPDAFLALTYVFGGLGAGDYVVTTTLHDRISGKSAAVSTPITIK